MQTRTASQVAPLRRLSMKERALWVLQRMVPGSGVSNETLAFTVDGPIIPAILQQTVSHLVARHPALRTLHPEVRGEPVAVVLPPDRAEVSLQVHRVASGQSADELLTTLARKPFDLSRQIPARVGLVRDVGLDIGFITLHHLAFDASSVGVLMRELTECYEAFRLGQAPPPALSGAGAHFAEELPDPADLEYWRASLEGIDADRLRLDVGRPPPGDPSFSSAIEVLPLSAAELDALAVLARRYRVTENIVLLAVFYLLLALHGGGPDLAAGVFVDVREDHQRDAVGYHVATLPLRLAVNLDQRFVDLVRSAARAFLTGLDHLSAGYEDVEHLLEPRTDWRSPLLRYMFNYRRNPVSDVSDTSGRAGQAWYVYSGYSRRDLDFVVEKDSGGARLRTFYATDIFDPGDIRAMQRRYSALLTVLAADDQRPMSGLDWWEPTDHAAIAAANDTRAADPAPPLANAIASVDPAAVAVVSADGDCSYGALRAAAQAMRTELVAAGVRPGDVVAVQLDRGPALAAAVLGIWAAGSAYLPLHPGHPDDLVDFQVTDCDAVALIGSKAHGGLDPISPPDPLAFDPADPSGAELTEPAPGDIAYVIFTSGSTGYPKGVAVTHANLANQIAHFAAELALSADDAVLWLSTFAFDISTLELILPLSVGGRAVAAPTAAHTDPELLASLLEGNRVRVVEATPTTWAALGINSSPALSAALRGRHVLCGGESLTVPLARQLLATGCHLHNVYGPTETTVWATTFLVTEPVSEPIPVGKPIRGVHARVSGAAGTPLPVGVTGELWLAGAGVTAGYRNAPERNQEKFTVVDGVRHYRSGDLARWRPDGQIELRGRRDRQVKVRGHRVELESLEATLATHPEVAAVAVIMHPELTGNSGPVAFVQPRRPAEPGTVSAVEVERELWLHARNTLPSYAVPSRIVLGPLPVTSNGKVDFAYLAGQPLPAPVTAAPRAVPGGGDLVAVITGAMQQVLDNPALTETDNFFFSGGHSLSAVHLIEAVTATTGHEIPLTALLDYPVPADLAAWLRGRPR